MKILTVDIGTGTQDIFLYDSRLDIENGFKLVLPSPTMMVYRRLKQTLSLAGTTPSRTPILLTGHQMGGGPSAWAIEEYARSGIPVFMTPDAATTINDELNKVEELGIKIVSEDESKKIKEGKGKWKVESLELKDFDFQLIADTFAKFGVSLKDLDAIAVAVFDHGNAPAGVSDRQFRFDYLDERIRAKNSLSAFAYRSSDIPKIMTRLQAVVDSANGFDCPLVVMDTAPAAVLGANFDPVVAKRERKIIVNVGNFHTLAFRLGGEIEGVFEHHTGEIDLPKLEKYLYALADGSLKHKDIFDDMGHGALVYGKNPFDFGKDEFDVVVTGPRRSMFAGGRVAPNGVLSPSKYALGGAYRDPPGNRKSSTLAPHAPSWPGRDRASAGVGNRKSLRPYFAVPFGDMMIAGCFGLLAATAEVLPDLAEEIHNSMRGEHGRGVTPWDVGN